MDRQLNQKSENKPLEEKDFKDGENLELKPEVRSCEGKSHTFKYTKKANEVKCDCGIGFLLSAHMEIWPDGHIYYNQELVI